MSRALRRAESYAAIIGQACLLHASVLHDAIIFAPMLVWGADSAVSAHIGSVLRHAIALVHHCLRHDNLQGALTPGAQELSMQCRQLLDDAAAARARAPMRDRITGADAVGAVAATSNGRRCAPTRAAAHRRERAPAARRSIGLH